MGSIKITSYLGQQSVAVAKRSVLANTGVRKIIVSAITIPPRAHRNFKNFLWCKSESSGSVTHGSPHRATGYQTLHSTALKSGGSPFFKIQECVRCSGIFHRFH